MSVPTEIVSTQDLAPGMYIAELDRPWLETPFLFQGFTISSEAEIAELQRYCDYVHVECRPGAEPPSAPLRTPLRAERGVRDTPRKAGLLARLAGVWGRKPPPTPKHNGPGSFYVDTSEAQVEMPRARSVYDESSATFGEMMERIREGGKVDTEVLDAAVTPMIESLLRNQDAMTWLALIKRTDDYTYGHSVSCAIYAIAFGRHLGLPKEDLKTLGLGGMLLDVGKTRMPKGLLAKPAKLTDEEFALMRTHVGLGEQILGTELDPRVLQMVRHHHERYDGSGYPDGLEGPGIPVFARIAGIVDCYDALITPRAYAPAVSAFDAMRELHKAAGREFQAEMVEQFIQAIGMFPNGALVELSTGEVGVVVEQNRARRLRPKIVVILDRDKQALAEPRTLDLNVYPAEPGEPDAKWIDCGLEVGAHGIDPGKYYL